MFKLPFNKIKSGKPVVVVEIGNDWLKVIEYNPASSGGEVTKVSLQKLSQIRENMSVVISKIFRDLSMSRQSVILCIPRHLITVRALDLPSVDPKEINDMINLQVGKQTPYSKEEIISAYKIIYSIREGYTKVMLAIAQRNVINERVETLRDAGIDIGRVSVSSEGVYNWFVFSFPQETARADSGTTAVLDIDSNYSDFTVIRSGGLIFTKNIFIGANHLANESEPIRDKLVEELKRCLERFYIEEKSAKIAKMYLSGATNKTEDMEIALASALDMAVERTDAFRKIRIKEGIRRAQGENMKLVSLTPILGASIKHISPEFDLTPGEEKVLKMMESKRRDLAVLGILFISTVMIFSIFLAISLYYKNAYLVQLKKKVTEISKESGEIEKMRLSIELVKSNLDAKSSSLSILHEIYKVTPPEIILTGIDIDENKQAILKGHAFAMSDVFKFVKKLEESPIFEDVKASYTRTKKDKENDRDVEYAEFEIVCHYERR